MMEEGDVNKIAKELQEAALTDVTQASVKEASPSLLTSDIKDRTQPTGPEAGSQPLPVPIETMVSSIPSVGIDSNPMTATGKTPLQPVPTFTGAQTPSSYYHSSPEGTPSPMPGYNPSALHDAKPFPPAAQPSQPSNPYRAVSGLGAHVPSQNAVPPNLFVPAPASQEAPQQPYFHSHQATPPPYTPPFSQHGFHPHHGHPHDPHHGHSHDPHSHHHCGGGHGHSHGGESFLEIPQDVAVPSWDAGHHHHHHGSEGLFGWFSNVGTKVFEKTKSSVESMITTLDPGMKAVLYSGGDVDIVVTTANTEVVEGIRQAFQEIFGRATVNGTEARSDIAPQPIGFTAGLRGAENKIENLRRSGAVHECQPLVSIESFIQEVFPDKWFEFSCLVLKDPVRNVDLTTFTQAVPVGGAFVQQAQEFTPNDYELRWSGLSVTVGEIMSRNLPHVHPITWHKGIAGVSRRESVHGAARVLATLYKDQCR